MDKFDKEIGWQVLIYKFKIWRTQQSLKNKGFKVIKFFMDSGYCFGVKYSSDSSTEYIYDIDGRHIASVMIKPYSSLISYSEYISLRAKEEANSCRRELLQQMRAREKAKIAKNVAQRLEIYEKARGYESSEIKRNAFVEQFECDKGIRRELQNKKSR